MYTSECSVRVCLVVFACNHAPDVLHTLSHVCKLKFFGARATNSKSECEGHFVCWRNRRYELGRRTEREEGMKG